MRHFFLQLWSLAFQGSTRYAAIAEAMGEKTIWIITPMPVIWRKGSQRLTSDLKVLDQR